MARHKYGYSRSPRAQLELAKNRERYKLLFASSPLPMWILDVETFEFLEVNDAAVKHYGYAREEFLKLKVTDMRHPEDVQVFKRLLSDEFRLDQTYEHKNLRHIKKDRTIISVEVSTHNIILIGRRAKIAAIVDETEKVQALKHVEVEQEKLKLSTEQIQIALHQAEVSANNLRGFFMSTRWLRLLRFHGTNNQLDFSIKKTAHLESK